MERRISPSMLIACVALFFALTGAGMAATGYRVTSIWQLSPTVRHALRGHEGAQGPQGIQGPQGVQGQQGSAGPSGINWSGTQTLTSYSKLTAGESTTVLVNCPSGSNVIAGGFTGDNDVVTDSFPKNRSEWAVTATLQPNATVGVVGAWAECVPTS